MNCKKILVLLSFVTFLISTINAQEASPPTSMLRDTLDGKFDFSRFIIDAKGFLPVLMLITEPALGGIGVAAAPLFLTPKESEDPTQYVPPDITAGFAMYTGNNSWMIGAGRIGTLPKVGLKYRMGVGYGNINLSFYRNFIRLGERERPFSINTLPIFGSLSKSIGTSNIYLGLSYLFLRSKLSPNFEGEVPPFITPKELDNHTATLSTFIEVDKRDNIFTPDQGYRLNLSYGIDASWTGSDFNYQRITATFNWFLPLRKGWVSGLRFETQHVFDDPPFYLLPSVIIRGIPAARYQGETLVLLETEQRYDFTLRWSGLVFGGLGKAAQDSQSLLDAKTVYSGGGGFRYLLARAFKIRAGVDVAVGSGGWGYYIVFGHNWNR